MHTGCHCPILFARYIFMKLKRWEAALIFACIAVFLCGFTLKRDSDALSDKLVRLHVVANSDSEADQTLKLKVRDAVLDLLRQRLDGVEDAGRAAEIIADSAPELESTALAVIGGEGYAYPVSVTLCREAFPTTEYDNFSLPAGEYLSLRVRIGAAAGHNWWCVIFPPICDAGELNASTASAIGLTGEETRLITEDSPGYVVKFRVIEWINSLMGLFD